MEETTMNEDIIHGYKATPNSKSLFTSGPAWLAAEYLMLAIYYGLSWCWLAPDVLGASLSGGTTTVGIQLAFSSSSRHRLTASMSARPIRV
jgi:hypothetical protein